MFAYTASNKEARDSIEMYSDLNKQRNRKRKFLFEQRSSRTFTSCRLSTGKLELVK